MPAVDKAICRRHGPLAFVCVVSSPKMGVAAPVESDEPHGLYLTRIGPPGERCVARRVYFVLERGDHAQVLEEDHTMALKHSRIASESLKGLHSRQREKPWDAKARMGKQKKTERDSDDPKGDK